MSTDQRLRVIGLMSGTSLDGCDVVLTEIWPQDVNPSKINIETKAFIIHPMPDSLREMIKIQLKPETSRIDMLAALDCALSNWFVEAVEHLLSHCHLNKDQIDLIGSHGQSMWHDVQPQTIHKMTWQLGDGSFIAAKTGITTVSDFRTADVALGGQGNKNKIDNIKH
jgi:anhydro-N-acetylmuramic acid kinase